MTQVFSLEFLVTALFILNAFLVLLLFVIIRRVSRIYAGAREIQESSEQGSEDIQTVSGSAREVLDLLTPLVRESKDAAISFEEQIREKRALSKKLNKALDSRIISINLLLSRAESLQKRFEKQQKEILDQASFQRVNTGFHLNPADPLPAGANVLDQQNKIIDLYYQKKDIDTIAQTLSIPRGEVQLVVDLKEKFLAMEQDN
ncbi:hypothetical protein [Desulfospira joergensenii]|uniref:hypothetical protein n=1 Tax=Desulfospira joergensenii TaxID=53329 RepID=UPI0003B3EE0C|nr:hypothetical protein [Desulfospira joergensenii]